MGMQRRQFLECTAAVLAAALPRVAGAAAYPDGPIKMIVPFPPAGGTDVVSRTLTQYISLEKKWNFVLENRAGAGGNIGLDAVAKARPDGLTIGMAQTSNLAINPALYANMPYDALKDFTPIALVASQPMVLVVGAAGPYKTLAELVAAAKAKPGLITMASAGTGTVGHLSGEMFARLAGIKITHVPYKGAMPALTDLISQQVDFNLATPQSALPLVHGGKLRALAVTSAQRLPAAAEVPTIAESGYAGFVAEDWKAVVAPAGTPPAIVKALNEAINQAVKRPEMRARMTEEGSKALGGSPEQFAALLKSEVARWGAAVRDSGAKVE
jgi:tripartite-type tricarboxylate transporter receptor subunit TctC